MLESYWCRRSRDARKAFGAVTATVALVCLIPSASEARPSAAVGSSTKVVDLVTTSPMTDARWTRLASRLGPITIIDVRGDVKVVGEAVAVGAAMNTRDDGLGQGLLEWRRGQRRLALRRIWTLEMRSVGSKKLSMADRRTLHAARGVARVMTQRQAVITRLRIRLPERRVAAMRRALPRDVRAVLVPVRQPVRQLSGLGEWDDPDDPTIAASVYAPSWVTPWTGYAPLGSAYPPPPPGTRGEFRKQHWVTFAWHDEQHLSWFKEANPRERGFEIQIEPASEQAIWSDGWGDPVVVNWASDLPEAYLDDLAFDGAIKGFAVGSANGAALEARRSYWAEWETNEGKTDIGEARVVGQATVRPAVTAQFLTPSGTITRGSDRPEGESGYCALHSRDSACYFARDAVEFGVYPIETTAPNPWPTYFVRYGPCPYGWDTAYDDEGRPVSCHMLF